MPICLQIMEHYRHRPMKAYLETGFDGPMRPDHAPTIVGESNDTPGYAVMGRVVYRRLHERDFGNDYEIWMTAA